MLNTATPCFRAGNGLGLSLALLELGFIALFSKRVRGAAADLARGRRARTRLERERQYQTKKGLCIDARSFGDCSFRLGGAGPTVPMTSSMIAQARRQRGDCRIGSRWSGSFQLLFLGPSHRKTSRGCRRIPPESVDVFAECLKPFTAPLLKPVGGSAPTGFSSGGQHKGFETFSNTSTDSGGNTTTSTARLPGGWDQGKADWKEPLQQSNPTITTLPPGLSNH